MYFHLVCIGDYSEEEMMFYSKFKKTKKDFEKIENLKNTKSIVFSGKTLEEIVIDKGYEQ